MTKRKNTRPDNSGVHESEFRKNKKKLLARCEVCAICGQIIDKSLKFPHPYSPSVDHIIPISKGGHPSAISNLALVHLRCNRLKSDHLPQGEKTTKAVESIPSQKVSLMNWD